MPRDHAAADTVEFALSLRFADLSDTVIAQALRVTYDTLGVGAAGAALPSARIGRDHAARFMAAGDGRDTTILFDGRKASAPGAAFAAATTIDALDAHDGYNPAKGHVGCALIPGILALAEAEGIDDGQEILATIVAGYELASRLGPALHATAPDYHTSGAWVAVALTACCARLLGLDRDQAAHAMGIAEYQGPRSQMMRVIDHPTMLKDGSGMGAMVGVHAAYLAQAGFTGAPAISATRADAAPFFADLGQRWLILEQYFKPYPVCRWAQAPIEGVLHLAREHGLSSTDVDHIEVRTFHEAVRLATNDPTTSDEAQYSTSYPCAVALVRGRIGVDEVSPSAFADPEVRRLSLGLRMEEDDGCNATFPAQRHAFVRLHLADGRTVESPLMSPLWHAEAPPTDAELRAKYDALAGPAMGADRAAAALAAVMALRDGGSVKGLIAAFA